MVVGLQNLVIFPILTPMLNESATSGYDQKPEIDLQQFSASATDHNAKSSEVKPPAKEPAKSAAPSSKPATPPPSKVPPAPLGNASSRRQGSNKGKKIALVVLGIILIFVSISAAVGFYSYSVAMILKGQAAEAEQIGRETYDAFKTQNLPATQEGLTRLEGKLAEIRSTYNKLGFYRFIPIASAYYNDGTHGLNAADAALAAGKKGVDAIVPYADVLGFAGEGTFTGGTAEDRLKLVIETLDKVAPQMDAISADLNVAADELNQIDENRYPENLRGIPVRSYVTQAKEVSAGAVDAVTQYRPIMEQLAGILGGRGERKKYLVLFQNDNELRPTGGFLTAYSVVFVENGKVSLDKSDDIYELDKKFTTRLPIPEALGRYLTTESRWNLRDMNISPDFKVSMDQFYENYQNVRGEPQDIDGIIALDTQVLVDLLKILGPVEVPGYGTFSAENDPRCDCPQVVYALSEIITRPTPYLRTDRKGILGPMMRAILDKAYAAPRQQWPGLFEAGLADIGSRHIQTYFFDEAAQTAAEQINAAGRMTPEENADFLGIVDANLGGAKSNLFTSYEVNQTVSPPENGRLTKTVEITYRNSRHGDNCNLEAGLLCLNSTLRDWNRLYLPAGSELIEAQGYTAEPQVYEENGFQVIDGFFTLEPNGQAKVRVTFSVPYTNENLYRLKLWKQGGVDPIKTLLDVNGNQEEVLVNEDQVVEIGF